MSSINKPPGRRYYVAHYKRWDAVAQTWKRAKCSTRCEDEEDAQAFLEAIEAQARQAARMTTGSALTRAHVEAIVTSILVAAGAYKQPEAPPDAREYLARYMAQKAAEASKGTVRAYKSSRRCLESWLPKGATLADISPAMARDYYTFLLSSCSSKTANDRFRFLRGVLNQAESEDLIGKNPCRAVKTAKTKSTLSRLPFTLEEALQIVNTLWESEDTERREWSLAASISLMTGARLADCLLMRKDAIKGSVLTYTQSKTGKTVSMPLVLPELVDRLKAAKGPLICPKLAGVFQRVGNAHLSSDFTGLVKECGVAQSFSQNSNGRQMARKTFHSLRHTLRSAIVASGGSDAQADLILGHAPGQGKTYTHAETDALKGVLSAALKTNQNNTQNADCDAAP